MPKSVKICAETYQDIRFPCCRPVIKTQVENTRTGPLFYCKYLIKYVAMLVKTFAPTFFLLIKNCAKRKAQRKKLQNKQTAEKSSCKQILPPPLSKGPPLTWNLAPVAHYIYRGVLLQFLRCENGPRYWCVWTQQWNGFIIVTHLLALNIVHKS